MRLSLARLLCGVLLHALCSNAQAFDLRVDLVPAWDGYQRPQRVSELGLLLRSTSSRRLTIQLTRDRHTLRSHLDLLAGNTQQVNLPVPIGRGATEIRIEGVDEVFLFQPELVQPGTLVATLLTSTLPLPATAGEPRLQAVSSASLPHTLQAYQAIDGLIIDRSAFLRLHAAQVQALQQYLGSCGAVMAVGFPSRSRAPIQALAGCDSLALKFVNSPDEIAATLQSWLRSKPASPGSTSTGTRQASASSHTAMAILLAMVITWFGTGILLLLLQAGAAWIAAYTLLSTLLFLVSWTGQEARIRIQDTALTNASLRHVRIDGLAPGFAQLRQPAGFGLPLAMYPQSDLDVQVDPVAKQYTFQVRTRLMSSQDYYFRGPVQNGG